MSETKANNDYYDNDNDDNIDDGDEVARDDED